MQSTNRGIFSELHSVQCVPCPLSSFTSAIVKYASLGHCEKQCTSNVRKLFVSFITSDNFEKLDHTLGYSSNPNRFLYGSHAPLLLLRPSPILVGFLTSITIDAAHTLAQLTLANVTRSTALHSHASSGYQASMLGQSEHHQNTYNSRCC